MHTRLPDVHGDYIAVIRADPIHRVGGHPALAGGGDMDGRTTEAKEIGRALAEVLNQDLDRAARVTELAYIKAERCRICGIDDRDLPNTTQVRRVIDRELMNGATYRAAVEAAEPFVAEWPLDQRPTYAAVRNHSKRHLDRDQTIIRQLMEAHALNAGIDIEEGEGPILTAGGVLAVIAQRGYEEVRDGHATPTVGETIAASRAMVTIEKEMLAAALEEERRKARRLMAALQELAPGALESALSSSSELTSGPESSVIFLPDAKAGDPADIEQVRSGLKCNDCGTVAKTERGLRQHRNRKHAEAAKERGGKPRS
jgi:hypothetical protein